MSLGRLCGLVFVLPIGFAIINCRIACRRCREKLDHPKMLEVYCAMCEECKERRREWLQGAPSMLRVDSHENHLSNYGQGEEDCPPTPTDEECEEPHRLTQRITTTTTTTTTRKPCSLRPCIKTTRMACMGVACPLPVAVPLCPICPLSMTESFNAVTSSTRGDSEAAVTPLKKLLATSSGASGFYFYVGIPKTLLKEIQLARP